MARPVLAAPHGSGVVDAVDGELIRWVLSMPRALLASLPRLVTAARPGLDAGLEPSSRGALLREPEPMG